jgi:hypothetical protein
MPIFREHDIEQLVTKCEYERMINGDPRQPAEIACARICEQLASGELNWYELPHISRLARFLVRDKATGRPLAIQDSKVHDDAVKLKNIGEAYEFVSRQRNQETGMIDGFVSEQTSQLIKEESTSTATTMGSFMALTSQLFFNALIGAYEHAEMNVARTFRNIPSTFLRGEKFAGIGGLEKILQGTPEGRELPHLTATEDYVDTPAQRKVGAIIDISWELSVSDHSGEILRRYEKLGKAVAVTREMEAVGTLTDTDPFTGKAGYTRTHYNWKGTQYATYGGSASTNWINLLTSSASGSYLGANPLTDQNNINNAYVTATMICDPWTGIPIGYGQGPWTLFCSPNLKFTAERILRTIEYLTVSGPAATTNFAPQMATGGQTVIPFNVVSSSYIGALCDQAASASNTAITRQTWWIGKPEEAFSWQTAQELVNQEAIPGAGDMFNRVLEKQVRCFDCKTAFVLNPRYILQCMAT